MNEKVLKDKLHECVFYAMNSYFDCIINHVPTNFGAATCLTVNNNVDVLTDIDFSESELRAYLKSYICYVHFIPDDPLKFFASSAFYNTLTPEQQSQYNSHIDFMISHDDYISDYLLYSASLLRFIKTHFENEYYIHIFKESKKYISSLNLKKLYNRIY